MKTVVGEIVKPQGIRGEIKIKPLVDDANYFNDLSVFFVENNKFTKKSCRVHQGFVYLISSAALSPYAQLPAYRLRKV